MDLSSIKKAIHNNTIDNEFKVFKYSDNTFIIDQYIEAIALKLNKTINYLEDLNESALSTTLDEDNLLNVYKTDKLDTFIDLKGLIIVCKDIDKDIISNLTPYLIEVPKTENRHIKEYLATKLPNLSNDRVEWLCKATDHNIYKIQNEIDKYNLFIKTQHNNIFDELKKSGNYSNLITFTIFDISNCIIKRDVKQLSEYLTESPSLENIDVFALIALLEKNFINILNIQTNPNITANDLGLNYKQFMAVRYNCNIYTNNQLLNILKIIFKFDCNIKTGYLNADEAINYLIVNILGV